MDQPLKVVLASGSPRRKELLAKLIPEFEVVVSNAAEEEGPDESPWQIAERLATRKANEVFALYPDRLVIGGDTVVSVEEEGWVSLGKPTNEDHAVQMLSRLSGRTHVVVTGICLRHPRGSVTASDTTQVRFRQLSKSQIIEYVSLGESFDKAGGYAIQGHAAGFIESIQGSTTNVVGLPLELLAESLQQIGFPSALVKEIG
jgi:septum formation protein